MLRWSGPLRSISHVRRFESSGRFVQHLHEPALIVSCWFPPPLRLRGVAVVRTVVPDDAEH
jgi:hypothetical protein